jgi:AraC family transcriptional regulator
MDYYLSIQNAVRYIEAHLEEELAIKEIAAAACFSSFHFQRLFQAISGFSVQEYIRKRRMTEAAAAIKASSSPILQIAAAYRYGSQEAFTRAFEAQFGITPAKYRRSELPITRQEPMNFLDYQMHDGGEMVMNKPELLHLEAVCIAGFEYKTTLEDGRYFREIPGFYYDFGSNGRFAQIPGRIRPAFSYGVSCSFQDNGDFSFVIGEETENRSERLAEGFVRLELEAGRYAVFASSGAPANVQNVRKYIYGTWLPNSNYERREGPDFEITDVCASSPDNLEMKIYIPIR